MQKPLVSVITPTYNHEAFIGQCIGSVLAQTYPHWEMIIVDDGSSDRTVKVARSSAGDARVRVIENPHLGIWKLHETYNMALKHSNGDLVAILEGDDCWPPYRLERQIPFFRAPGTVLCYGSSAILNRQGKILRESAGPSRHHRSIMMNRPPGKALRMLLSANRIAACTTLISRNALDKAGGFCQPYGLPAVDYPTWLNLALLGEFGIVDSPMGYWRTYSQQVTRRLHIPLYKGASHYAIDFFRNLPPHLKKRTGWTESGLIKVGERTFSSACSMQARYCLLCNDRAGAAPLFREAVQRGSWKIRTLGLIGLICCVSPCNLEKVMRLTGRFSLEDAL